MKRPSFTNIAVFALFFGIALIEAVKKHNWLEACLFLALGAISLWVDIRKR
jgi:predicted membrane channel-forming protein YqfA (hemolysin III family)